MFLVALLFRPERVSVGHSETHSLIPSVRIQRRFMLGFLLS